MPKVEIVNGINLRIDLSDLDEEVRDYVTSQLPDRIMDGHELREIIGQIEYDDSELLNNDKPIVTVTSVILELIESIKDEKLHDIDYERRHGERD